MKKKILASILVGLMLSLIISPTSANAIVAGNNDDDVFLNIHVCADGENCPQKYKEGIGGVSLTIEVLKNDEIITILFAKTNENGWIDDSAAEGAEPNYVIPRGSDIKIWAIPFGFITDEETAIEYKYNNPEPAEKWYYNVLGGESHMVFSEHEIIYVLQENKARSIASAFPFLSNFPFFQKLITLPIFSILFN